MGYTKPQTEIAFIPLKPGVDVSSSEDRRVLLDALAIMKRQEGCKGVWFGVPSEKSGEVEVEVEVEVVIGKPHPSSTPLPPTFSTLLTPTRLGRRFQRPHLHIHPRLRHDARRAKRHYARRAARDTQREYTFFRAVGSMRDAARERVF